MGRRDFLVVWLQALLLSLFPWLRTERGLEVAGAAAEAMVPADVSVLFKQGSFRLAFGIVGYELSPAQFDSMQRAAAMEERVLFALRDPGDEALATE